ncbi:TatD family hydrolase [Candidatus Bathyarchaeota archaeon]|nr:TatD family hydrolase [Candidatus Bathyarchaeota archaeon]MBS7630713.1 TatD family hydrolase [Candidatus Bathyarchaeota archaeon]
MKLIDSHAHLSDLAEVGKVVERAKRVGISAIIAVGANLRTCRSTLALSEDFPKYVYPALGIHPTEWYTEDVEESLRFVEERVGNCVAVGEIGLDYWDRESRKSEAVQEKQREIYVRQLRIARENGKPVSIHGRGAWSDALNLAKEEDIEKAVFHWYSGPLDVLIELLDSGYFISATPAAEFSRDHRAALAKAPLEKILIETDSPVSYHGAPSEPADLVRTLRALAELKEVSIKEAARMTTLNSEKFFDLS